jgi:DNA mismatch repair ATPase MutS
MVSWLISGIGLFCALIDHLCVNNKPRVLAATHYHECIQYGYVDHLENLSFHALQCHMDSDKLIFLYKVIPGAAGSSMGLECAKSVGFDSEILDRICQISSSIISGAPIPQIFTHADRKKQTIAKELCGLFNEDIEFKVFWSRVRQLADHL